jgi:hypothetical protein
MPLTKLQTKTQNPMTTQEIRKKCEYGDFQVLAKVLGISSEAAKARFARGDKTSMEIMLRIIENRNQLIADLQQNIN